MKVIGLIGGVASGKSFAAECLRRLGAYVFDADRAGHEVLRDPEVIAAAAERWGKRIIDDRGQIDRSALGKIVFAPTSAAGAELRFLEELTHPRITTEMQRKLDDIRAQGRSRVVVLDAALLLRAGWDRLCDLVVFVDAPRDMRRTRAAQRGWDDREFERRERMQESLDFKRKRADIVLDNSQSAEVLTQQIRKIWDSHLG